MMRTAASLVWLKERWRDVFLWPVNMVRDFPRRLGRLLVLGGREATVIALLPGEVPFTGRTVRLHSLLVCLFDLLGGPEVAQYWMHMFVRSSPLRQCEIEALTSVFGPNAMRYGDVRIAEGGILPLIFRINGGRAFCTWHTIHLQQDGPHTRANLALLVHEATHIFQYERCGTIYIGRALYAQRRFGRGAYNYGGVEGLQRAQEAGAVLADFNPEAQAQIAQDYYARLAAAQDVEPYMPYIRALRAGRF